MTAQRQPLVTAGTRFLVVWLMSALLTGIVVRALAWSGVVISEGVELILLMQPALVSLLMAWWRWSPADAPDDILIAIGTGIGTAVLSVWVNIAVIATYHALVPPPDALPLSVWGVLGPLVVFSILALITGFVGAGIGALLAKYLRGGDRSQRDHPERMP